MNQPAADYPETLYAYARTADLLPDLAAIGPAEERLLADQGYLAIERAFDADLVAGALDAIADLVAGRNRQFNDIEWENHEGKVDIGALTPAQRTAFVRKLMDFTQYDPRLERILHDPNLTALLTRLCGEPPQCIQEMALLKPPSGGREKPWHQDRAYFDYPMDKPCYGLWTALDAATADNGCMHIVAGTHHEPVPHFARRDWQICDTTILGREIIAVELPPGGALLFSGLLMHGTPTNYSLTQRRALQYHYSGASAAPVPTEERLAVFGTEGRDVSC